MGQRGGMGFCWWIGAIGCLFQVSQILWWHELLHGDMAGTFRSAQTWLKINDSWVSCPCMRRFPCYRSFERAKLLIFPDLFKPFQTGIIWNETSGLCKDCVSGHPGSEGQQDSGIPPSSPNCIQLFLAGYGRSLCPKRSIWLIFGSSGQRFGHCSDPGHY